MTDQSDRIKNWVLKHCNKLRYNQLQCKYCERLVPYDVRAKVHLFRKHQIDEDNNDDYIANKRKNLIWQYFREEEKYAPTCNICNKKLLTGYNLENLNSHLIKKHKETIERLQNIIRMTCIGQHYKFTTLKIITCKICNSVEINIYCIYNIIQHIELYHINVETENTVANIRNAIKESIEIARSTSQTSTHLQAEESEDKSTTEDIIERFLSSQENAPSTSQTYEYTTEDMDYTLRVLSRQENAPSTSQTSTHLQAEKSEDVPPKKKKKY